MGRFNRLGYAVLGLFLAACGSQKSQVATGGQSSYVAPPIVEPIVPAPAPSPATPEEFGSDSRDYAMPSYDNGSAPTYDAPRAAPAGGYGRGDRSAAPKAEAYETPTTSAGPSDFSQPYAKSTPAGAPTSRRAPEVAPESRPGLATSWGETRQSSIESVSFYRESASTPWQSFALHYNDERGVRGFMNQQGFFGKPADEFVVRRGPVSVGLRSGGDFLPGFASGSKNFVIGKPGSRYTIVLKNSSPLRLECVVSVDGLDVMDGKSASFAKRGYILAPYGEVEVDGFRQSEQTVAAFRFGSVADSYSNQKYGEARNVGVIGVAVFRERGSRQWIDGEVRRRLEADPFPSRFATPPN